MQVPLRVTIRDIPDSAAIEAKIEKKIAKLQQICQQIIGCHVMVEVPQKHKHQGKLFSARIDLTVPHKEIVVTRVVNEDLYVAIRDAFSAARRQLESHIRKQRQEVKNHAVPLQGQIVRLFPDQGYGFIDSPDGTEYYFHALNVAHPHFEHLTVGMRVEFLTMVGNDGLQATKVSSATH